MKHRLHVVALPHTTLTERDASCAYSQKVRKFVPMMRAEGHHVILYGPDEIACEPDEHVVISTADDRDRWGFGSNGFDTVRGPLVWERTQPYFAETNARALAAILERREERDFLCLTTSVQDPIVHGLGGWTNPISVEWTVGYEGVWSPFAAYESYAWLHHVYGLRQMRSGNGHQFDTVIPNFFEPDAFNAPPKRPQDYLLFIGRVIHSKGVQVAADLARRSGRKLVIAGHGAEQKKKNGAIVSTDGMRLEGDIEYRGPVGFRERADLMSNAYATLVPTLYLEPFGGVAVEAMMSGCPVIASDWGSFTEIVTPDVGRRFRTLRQGDAALYGVAKLDRQKIRQAAIDRYSLDAVGPRFSAWFDSLYTLWDEDGYNA